jgi:molybdopterin-guanine dinucleotide biosynthesis protein A
LPTAPARQEITGLVLAGGLARRMGGVDKGLQPFRGQPLARHALERLRPQVGTLMLNANRHLDVYAAWGVPVWPDATGDFAGPLAGLLAGLDHARTPWVACVPCDGPAFPPDLVARLAAHAADADVVMPVTPARQDGPAPARPQPQPVFSLVRRAVADDLRGFLAAGGGSVEAWARRLRCVELPFDDAAAFANANTLAELSRLEHGDA